VLYSELTKSFQMKKLHGKTTFNVFSELGLGGFHSLPLELFLRFPQNYCH